MAALLVGLAVMAVVLSVAMPTWSHMIRREKEEELIFRGTQYARAINQYQRKFANASPAEPRCADRTASACERNSGSVVAEQRRRISAVVPADTGGRRHWRGRRARRPRSGARQPAVPAGTGTDRAGSIGRRPTAPDRPAASSAWRARTPGTSITIYKGKTHYNEWQFIGMEQSTQAGHRRRWRTRRTAARWTRRRGGQRRPRAGATGRGGVRR